MEKTTTIHLNQTVFTIEEKAYSKLEKYFESIRKHFSKKEDAEEIISDIEASAALQFSEKTKKSHKILTLEDIEEMIATMGDVKAIDGEEETESETEKPGFKPGKRLFRDTDNKILGGVAAGVASYIGMEVSLFRILLVAIFLLIQPLSGPMFLTYFILWVLLPKAETSADKIMMKGEPINLSAIENEISGKTRSFKGNGLEKIIRVPIEIVSQLAKLIYEALLSLGPALSSIIGLLIIVATALGIAGLTSVAVNLAVNPVAELSQTAYLTVLGLVYFIAFVPLMFVLQIGSSLMKRKSDFSFFWTIFTFMMWIAAIITLAFTAVRLRPVYGEKVNNFLEGVHFGGSGSSEPVDMSNMQEFSIGNFDRVEANGIRELTIKKGETIKLSAYGKQEEIDRVRIEAENGKLKISNARNDGAFGLSQSTAHAVKIEIEMPVTASLNIVGNIKTDINISQETLMDFASLGNSSVHINGSIPTMRMVITGNSEILATDMISSRIELKVIGNNNIEVNPSDQLEIDAVGNSVIRYLGSPKVSQKIIGNTKVEKVEKETAPLPTNTQESI